MSSYKAISNALCSTISFLILGVILRGQDAQTHPYPQLMIIFMYVFLTRLKLTGTSTILEFENAGVDDVNIIVEDDIVFDSTFDKKMVKFVKDKMYSESDIVFFGLPSTVPMKDDHEIEVVHIPDKQSILPCSDSYYISKETDTTFSKSYIPITFPHNVQLSYLINTNNCTLSKTFPNIMADGSKIGTTPSTIYPNNILIFNSTYKNVYKLLEKSNPTNKILIWVQTKPVLCTSKASPDVYFQPAIRTR